MHNPNDSGATDMRDMTREETEALAEKILNLVREECPKGKYFDPPGNAFMLAGVRIFGWEGLKGLIR